MTPPLPPAQPHLDREHFDLLVQQRVAALMDEAEAEQAQARRRAIRQTARDLELRARAFADGVERASDEGGSGEASDGATLIEYEQAVVIHGKLRTVVTDEAGYDASPFYWQALASRPERVEYGSELLADLRGAGQPEG